MGLLVGVDLARYLHGSKGLSIIRCILAVFSLFMMNDRFTQTIKICYSVVCARDEMNK